MKNEIKKQETHRPALLQESLKRRAFIKYSGVTAGMITLALAGCKKTSDPMPTTTPTTTPASVDLGSGDTGILNYAYALEQLEAAFYTMVVAGAAFGTTFSAAEQSILKDIRDHEIIHRDFLKAALGAKAIAGLEVNFSSVNFSNRASVLGTAKTFEDLGVSAYNGAGNLLVDPNLLLVAGKIVSVEARHAAAIRDLLNPKSGDFAGDDVVDTIGLDGAKTPTQVLTAAAPFIKTKITASSLPTS